jgi:hypothetical protein
MTSFIVFLFFVAIYATASIVSILDMQPQRRPPVWSIGRMIDRR